MLLHFTCTYNLLVACNNNSGDKADQTNEEAITFRIAFGSCANQDKPQPLLNVAANLNPDAFIYLGDNIYGDSRTMDTLQAKYDRLAAKPEFQNLWNSTTVLSIWDDHDFGPNNCDGNYENKGITKEVFDDFWVNPNEPHENGIYYNFKYGDCELFMLDDRWNRNKDTTKGEKQVLGKEQLKWLKESLEASTASFKVIAFGNQVLNYYEDLESFQQYKKERDELYAFIKEKKINGVVFFSGDRHHAEVIKTQEVGLYPFYDFTCSALSSWRAPWRRFGKEWKNENRIGDISLKHNYSVVSISGIENKRVMKVTYKNKKGKVLMEFTVKQEEISF